MASRMPRLIQSVLIRKTYLSKVISLDADDGRPSYAAYRRAIVTARPSPFRADLLRGKVALITGGTTGLGLEIARVLGGHVARVAICSRRETNLRAAATALREAGIDAVYGVCDVRRHDEVTAVVEEVLRTFGRLDIVVSNAAGNFPVASQWRSSSSSPHKPAGALSTHPTSSPSSAPEPGSRRGNSSNDPTNQEVISKSCDTPIHKF